MDIQQRLLISHQLRGLKNKIAEHSGSSFYEQNVAELYLLRKSCELLGIPFRISRLSVKERENDEDLAKNSDFTWILNDHVLFRSHPVAKARYFTAMKEQGLECFEKPVDFLLEEPHVRWENSGFYDQFLNMIVEPVLDKSALYVSMIHQPGDLEYVGSGLFFYEKQDTFEDFTQDFEGNTKMAVCNAQNVRTGMEILNTLSEHYRYALRYLGEPENLLFKTHFKLEERIDELLKNCQAPDENTTSFWLSGSQTTLQLDGNDLEISKGGFIHLNLNQPQALEAFEEMLFAYDRYYYKMGEYSYDEQDFAQSFVMGSLPLTLQQPRIDLGENELFLENSESHTRLLKDMQLSKILQRQVKSVPRVDPPIPFPSRF